jgi:hypothetical protein
MKYKILGVRWIGSSRGQLGVVAFETDDGGWCAAIGIIQEYHTEDYSKQDIAEWGARLFPQEAHGFFPQLDVKKYSRV